MKKSFRDIGSVLLDRLSSILFFCGLLFVGGCVAWGFAQGAADQQKVKSSLGSSYEESDCRKIFDLADEGGYEDCEKDYGDAAFDFAAEQADSNKSRDAKPSQSGASQIVVKQSATTTNPAKKIVTTTTTSTTTTLPGGYSASERQILRRTYVWGSSSQTRELQQVLGISADGVYGDGTRTAHIAALNKASLSTSRVPDVPIAPTTTTTTTTTTPPPTLSMPYFERIFVECGWRFACSLTNDVRDYRDIRIWVVAHPCIEGLASVIRIEVTDLLNGSVTYWDSTCKRLKEVSQAGRAAFTCSHNDSLEYSDKTVLATLSHYVPDRPDINLVKRIQTFPCLESYSYRKY